MNKAEIKYKCQIEGSNSELDDEMDKQYGNNLNNIIFSILNIAGYSIVFLFAICLQFMRNKGIIGIPPVSSVVPVYPGAYPAPVYDAPYGKNWLWRATREQINDKLAEDIAYLTELYARYENENISSNII